MAHMYTPLRGALCAVTVGWGDGEPASWNTVFEEARLGAVALASWRVQIIKRSDGKSAVAAAAYRSAQILYDEYTGLTHSYVHKQDVISTEILAPANAPFWVYDPDQLWNRAGGAERQFNGQVAREVRIALPRELTQEQNIDLARSFAQYFANQGMVAHVSVHDRGDGNPHS